MSEWTDPDWVRCIAAESLPSYPAMAAIDSHVLGYTSIQTECSWLRCPLPGAPLAGPGAAADVAVG